MKAPCRTMAFWVSSLLCGPCVQAQLALSHHHVYEHTQQRALCCDSVRRPSCHVLRTAGPACGCSACMHVSVWGHAHARMCVACSLGMDREALRAESSKRLKHGESEEQPKKKKVRAFAHACGSTHARANVQHVPPTSCPAAAGRLLLHA